VHQHRPRGDRLAPGSVSVDPPADREFPFGGSKVVVSQPERFADPAAAVIQHGEQETIPQVLAGIQDRLDLSGGQYPGQLLRGLQGDRAPRDRRAFADVMQKWLPSATASPGWLPGDEQLAHVNAVPRGVDIECAQRR
jgi:hypothetical protein